VERIFSFEQWRTKIETVDPSGQPERAKKATFLVKK